MIKMSNVIKSYKIGQVVTPVIKGLELAINKGEFVSIVGPSGSGKSTLLNLIGCLDKPDSGEVKILDTDVTMLSSKSASKFRAKHLGFIFQDFNLLESFTVYENIEFALTTILKIKNPRSKVETILESIDMLDQINKYPDQLSGGQKQRVAVARALVVEPVLVLADEPTANLDSVSAQKVISLMKLMQARSNTTFIFSTHDHKIVDVAKRVITLEDGHIVNDTKEVK